MSASQESPTKGDARPGWYGSEASAVAQELGVEPERGLSGDEARRAVAVGTEPSLSAS